MRATTFIALAVSVASVAASPAVSSVCSAQNIVDACLATFKPRLAECKGNDWACYCTEATNIQTCYNNCPKSDHSGVDSQVVAWCGAYSATLPTTTSAVAVPTKTATTDAQTTDESKTATDESNPSPTTTGAKTTKSPSAGNAAAPAWGLMAGVAAVVGAML